MLLDYDVALHTTQPYGLATAGQQTGSTDAVTLLSIYLFLLMLIPSVLGFNVLGGSGSPATLFAIVLFLTYLIAWLHPALAPASGRQPIRVAVITFFCALLATYVSVNRLTLPTLQANGADRGVILVCGWLGVALLAADGIDRIDRLHTLLRRLVLGAAAMGALAVTQFFTGLDLIKYIVIPGLVSQTPYIDVQDRGTLRRPSATALDPIELAAVLAVALPIAVHWARYAPPGKRGWRWLQVGFIVVALPMTLSRTAFTALAAVVLVVLPVWPRRERWYAYVIGLVGMTGMALAIPGLFGTFRTLFEGIGSDTSSTSRTGAFSSAMPFIQAHPWFGHGFGTFLPETYFFTDDQYLLTLIEMGLLGLAALVTMFVTGWVTARRARSLSTDPETRHLAQCLAAAVVASAVCFATLDAFSFMIISGVTFLVLGCIGAQWRLIRTGEPPAWTEAGSVPGWQAASSSNGRSLAGVSPGSSPTA
jgi:polysaccharide biosynthesis protein PslJ